MTSSAFSRRVATVAAALVSPSALWALAALSFFAYASLHAAGMRHYAAFLSGTLEPGPGRYEAFGWGVAYVLAYFSFVIGSPILTLGGVFLWAATRVPMLRGCAKRPSSEQPPDANASSLQAGEPAGVGANSGDPSSQEAKSAGRKSVTLEAIFLIPPALLSSRVAIELCSLIVSEGPLLVLPFIQSTKQAAIPILAVLFTIYAMVVLLGGPMAAVSAVFLCGRLGWVLRQALVPREERWFGRLCGRSAAVLAALWYLGPLLLLLPAAAKSLTGLLVEAVWLKDALLR